MHSYVNDSNGVSKLICLTNSQPTEDRAGELMEVYANEDIICGTISVMQEYSSDGKCIPINLRCNAAYLRNSLTMYIFRHTMLQRSHAEKILLRRNNRCYCSTSQEVHRLKKEHPSKN